MLLLSMPSGFGMLRLIDFCCHNLYGPFIFHESECINNVGNLYFAYFFKCFYSVSIILSCLVFSPNVSHLLVSLLTNNIIVFKASHRESHRPKVTTLPYSFIWD